MTFSEEILTAYADNELDPRTRAAVDAAMASDPKIARRIEQYTALRLKLRAGFDGVLNEPVPDRLITAARTAPTTHREAAVIPLRRQSTPRWSWPQWGSIAASLIVGAIAGQLLLRSSLIGPITERNGQLLASGGLARALSEQLASNQPPGAPVQIGVSFRSKSGDYCRTFALHDASTLAGLACHVHESWRINTLAQREPQTGSNGQYRPAGSALPSSVLRALDEEIEGNPLDARAEIAARDMGWTR